MLIEFVHIRIHVEQYFLLQITDYNLNIPEVDNHSVTHVFSVNRM